MHGNTPITHNNQEFECLQENMTKILHKIVQNK